MDSVAEVTPGQVFPAPQPIASCPIVDLPWDQSVKNYGAPGVEFSAVHPDEKPVKRIFFVPNQGRVIAQCDDQSFHLWEINEREDGTSCLEHVKEVSTEDRLKIISAACLQTLRAEEVDQPVRHRLLIGTESGNVYEMNVDTLELADYIIYQDTVVPGVSEEHKSTAGAVECFSCAGDSGQLLIGYTRALIVLWDCNTNTMQKAYATGQSVESVCWHSPSAHRFISSHNDGSYVEWSVDEVSQPFRSPNIPFGPFPCKPIDRIVWKTTSNADDELLLFSGGMTRASFGDRHTLSVQRTVAGKNLRQVVFDMTSKLIDFVTLDANIEPEMAEPHTLLCLCEEELIAIDLLSPDWPMFRLPYLWPLHASPISACQYVADVAQSVVDTLIAAGLEQKVGRVAYSRREWPIQGGRVNDANADARPTDLLVTGHEDGTVRFWTADGVCMRLVFMLNIARLYQEFVDPHENSADDDDDWPPFRRVGLYDPFSDDPRFGVQRVMFDGATGRLAIGGCAGQTLVWSCTSESTEVSDIKCIAVNVVPEGENFTWKGDQALTIRDCPSNFEPGFALDFAVQLSPPAAVTALALNSNWNLVAVGTGHGFALIDTKEHSPVYVQCLLNAAELSQHDASALEQTMTRFKSFKKSLRDSFRRRRRHAATNSAGSPSPVASPQKSPPKRASPKTDDEEDEVKPVERSVEARAEQPDAFGSLVRSLVFAETYVTSATELSRSLWVGTNGGAVRIHVLHDKPIEQPIALSTVADTPAPETSAPVAADPTAATESAAVEPNPAEQPAATAPVADPSNSRCQLAKEIQLQHGAPVLAICIVDHQDRPIETGTNETNVHEIPASTQPHHRVIVVSEEQIKSFTLPSLKAGRHKYKLTAQEGARMRKTTFTTLASRNDCTKLESFLIVMTNHGELQSFNLHSFRRYLKVVCVESSDVHGILSTVLSPHGEGLSLSARGSEWLRFAVASSCAVRARCSLELPEGVRPVRTIPVEETEAVAETSTQQEPPAPPADVEKPNEETSAKPETASPAGEADTSLDVSAGNTSAALPTDITVDSIRDYTKDAAETVVAAVETTVTEAVEAIAEKLSPPSNEEKKEEEDKHEASNAEKIEVKHEVQTTTTTTTTVTEVGDAVVVETQKIETVTNGHDDDHINGNAQLNGEQHSDDEIAKLKEEIKEKMKVETAAQPELPSQ